MIDALPSLLVAEDEETDALILRFAYQKARVPNPLVIVRDGQEAIDYLSGTGPLARSARRPLPALLILDIKMPRLDGFDVLAWLRGQPQLKNLPAVILSSSSHHDDIQRARQMGARDYFVKPYSIQDLVNILETIRQRWLSSNHEPE